MMSRLMTSFNVVVGIGLATVVFWYLSDHSWPAVLHWTLFFVAGFVQPLLWTRRTERLLGSLGVPITPALRTAALYPILVGMMTAVLAVSLIARAGLR